MQLYERAFRILGKKAVNKAKTDFCYEIFSECKSQKDQIFAKISSHDLKFFLEHLNIKLANKWLKNNKKVDKFRARRVHQNYLPYRTVH
jgi:hypothetical protein